MASLTTLSAPALAYVGGNYSTSSLSALTTLSAPALAYVGGNYSPGPLELLTTLSAPVLAYVGGSYQPNTLTVLTTLSAPALAFVGLSYSPTNTNAVIAIDLPALTSVGVNLARTVYTNGRILPSGTLALTSFTMPVIEVIGSSSGSSIGFISNSTSLATFTMGSSLRRVEGSVVFTFAALLVASVDDILVRLAALDGTGLTTAYSTKTVTITGTSATPSATGLAAKATLVARGCTVTHN